MTGIDSLCAFTNGEGLWYNAIAFVSCIQKLTIKDERGT